MTIIGYSDRINHALAFAAKHHDQQVRKGTRAPYQTHPSNVAIILTRYGRDEPTVVAGILHDVVENYVRDGYTREMLHGRIGDKFGADVVDTVVSIAPRKFNDAGIELDAPERRADYLARLAEAGDAARWICAADKLHNAATLLADLRRTVDPDTVWSRLPGGRDGTAQWKRRVFDRLHMLGFEAPIMSELNHAVSDLEGWSVR